MSTQPLLPLLERAPIATHVCALIELLKLSDRWWTRLELCERLGWSEREVRAVVSAAWQDGRPQIVRGQKGFAHIEHCTLEEIKHAANQRLCQAKEEERYALGLLRTAHERIA